MFFTKKITVLANQVAIVSEDSKIVNVLVHGVHRIANKTQVQFCERTQKFNPVIDLDILLQESILVDFLDIVIVKENEIAVQFKDGIFKAILVSGKHAYWKNNFNYSYEFVSLDEIEFPDTISDSILKVGAMRYYVNTYKVEPYEKALLKVDGVYKSILDAGVYNFVNGVKSVEITKVDLRKSNMEINGQELLTKDKASLRVNFYTSYRVIDVMKAINDNSDYYKQLYLLIQLAIRSYIGNFTLDELLANKTKLDEYILENIKSKATELGVEVVNCGIRDIILPGDVKEIMNQVLVAEKKAQANVIMRREETASTRSLLNTAKLMQDNEMLYKLKEMEYVEKIAENIQNMTLSGNTQVVDQLKGLFTR